jgi:hypothetical protein
MISSIHAILAQTTDTETRRRAEAWRAARPPRRRRGLRRAKLSPDLFEGRGITIRYAYPDDEPALIRLAQLDEAEVPAGRVLLAEVADELWAAASIDGGEAVADPFRPSGPLVSTLLELGRASVT